jgi:hypothetical protein
VGGAAPLDRPSGGGLAGPSVRLLHVNGDKDSLLAALLFESAGVPEEVNVADCGDDIRRCYEVSAAESERLVDEGRGREAMQLIELRSGREGHPSYRAVAHEMPRLIASIQRSVAAAMTHVDAESEPRLERILAEMRTQAKRDALA